MAAGSILYRPFNKAGLLFKNFPITDDLDFAAATADGIINAPKDGVEAPVDQNFLEDLLDLKSADEQACMPGAGKGGERS